MVKTTQSYSGAQDSNTALTSDGGVAIPLGEGQMLPRHVNDAVRALMADMANDLKAGGRPATQTETFVVRRVEDNSAKGSMPAQSNIKLEIDGALNPHLLLTGTASAPVTYTFDTSDSSMTAALRFYADSSQTTEHTAGVTINGTAGTAGASTAIVVTENTPRILYYQLDGSAGVGGLAISAASSEALANVTGAVTQAEDARDDAQTAQGLAETARDAAQTAETNAETAETNAETAEANAVSARDTAQTHASNASSAQAAAESARDLALTYRNDAQNAKTDAVTAKDLILASQDDNLWLGGFAATAFPTTDNDGNALLTGAALYDTTNSATKIFNGTSFESVGGSIASTDLTDSANIVRNNADQTISADLTVNNLITSGNVDGQDVSQMAADLANAPQITDATNRGHVQGIDQALTTSSDVNFNSLTLAGGLTVNGSTTTVSTTNLVVSDSLIELSNGLTGTPTGDAGIIIERGDSDNAIFAWDESDDRFVLGTTTETGGSSGNLTITNANLALADLTLTGIAAGSTTTATGSATWDVTAAQMAIITASGATTVTISNASQLSDGAGLTLIVNDASGASLTIAGATSFKYPSATAPTLSGTPGEVLVVSFIHTGGGNLIASNVTVS